MLQIKKSEQPSQLHIVVSDTLEKSDYDKLQPALANMAKQHDSFTLLWDMRDFTGWSLKAGWEDIKTDSDYNDKVRKTAMVGENKWQKWMTILSKPFAKGELRYFDSSDLSEAKAWLGESNE